MADCNNNCEAVAGLNEAAANLVQYSKLINKWLNGGSEETVNVGGQTIPTLLGLACAIRQLVGVWPDGLTIKMNPANKKIYVPLKTNGGVHVDSGGLFVDSSDFIQLGGGLAKDSSGKIYVDFGAMPTNKFENLLKALRLPIWLTANTNFYVNKSHASASDTLNEGRGLSASKPFKTIQACINYIATNYNLSNFNVNVLVAGGTYTENISLPPYTATTGTITIKPQTDSDTVAIRGYIYGDGNKNIIISKAIFYNIDSSSYGTSAYNQFYLFNGGSLTLTDCQVKIDTANSRGMNIFSTYAGGIINIGGGTNDSYGFKLSFNTSAISLSNVFYSTGNIYQRTHCVLEGNPTITQAFATVANAGLFQCLRSSGWSTLHWTGTATGKRYNATLNGIFSVQGGGPNFFPGSTAGTTATGGQYA